MIGTSQETTTRDRKRSFPFVRIYTSINDILPGINLLHIFRLNKSFRHSWAEKKIDGATVNQHDNINLEFNISIQVRRLPPETGNEVSHS